MAVSPRDEPIENLGLSVRAYNCLKRAGLRTVSEVLSLSDGDLLAIRNLGSGSLAEIRRKFVVYRTIHPETTPPTPNEPETVSPSVLAKVTEAETQSSFADSWISLPLETLKLSPEADYVLRIAGCKTLYDVAILGGQKGLQWTIGYSNPELLAEIQQQTDLFFTVNPSLRQPTPLEALGLSVRPYNALMRRKIYTVDALAQMSEDDIWEVPNIGTKSLTEIQEKLETYLAAHCELFQPAPSHRELEALSLPPPPPTLIHPDMLAVAQDRGVPLDEISVDRLALCEWDLRLLQKTQVKSIGELARQPQSRWKDESDIAQNAKRYLGWLIEQDETTWTLERENRGISPLHRRELAEVSLDDFLWKWLEVLRSREKQIINWRYGLDGEALTLEDVGQRLDITRERVRQIQNRALSKLQHRFAIVRSLKLLLVHLVKQNGGLIDESQLTTVLDHEMTIDTVRPIGVARLVFEIDDAVKWHPKIQAWALINLPLDELEDVQRHLSSILEKECAPLPLDEIIARFKATRFYRNRQETVTDDVIRACVKVHAEISLDENGLCELKKWERHRTDEVILTLRAIGEPAHYTLIAQRANKMLEKEMRTPVRNFYTMLCHRTELFVRVGRGIFGLKEWGLSDDGNLANAAYRVLAEAGKPLHIEAITDLVLDTWHVGRASVQAAILQDDRFYRAAPATFGLLEWEIERLDEELPVLHICPPPLPDRRGERNTFFESVLVAHNFLCERPTVASFLEEMLKWVGTGMNKSERYLQNVLNAFYIVGLIPYVIYRRARESSLRSTLPQISDLQALRHFCCGCMLERLEGMHDFLALLAARQPCTATELTKEFHTDIYALRTARDEVLNRLRILRSLGILVSPDGGRYRLTETGLIQCANMELSGSRFQSTSGVAEALASISVYVDEDIDWLDIT